ncbi:MAG: hypothetical protein M0037_13660 [Betaproteobacteria bacterium]|nr:hypothetical protein [Betaproteobacteria bacterium]
MRRPGPVLGLRRKPGLPAEEGTGEPSLIAYGGIHLARRCRAP